MGIRECARIGLVEPGEVEDGTVVRMKKAYPVYDQHYHEALETIRQYLATIPNLQTVGRNGLHRYNNQDHSMLTAVYAARNIVGEKNDVWSVNTEMEYHEEVRSEKAPAADKAGSMGDRLTPSRVSASVPVEVSDAGADELLEAAFAKLDPVALGTAIGAVAGLGLFLATALLLLKGGDEVGPNLALLRHYFIGFSPTWAGALIGAAESAILGFALGSLTAGLRNWGLAAYAVLLKRHAEAQSGRDLLD
jgi:hypothetical protein